MWTIAKINEVIDDNSHSYEHFKLYNIIEGAARQAHIINDCTPYKEYDSLMKKNARKILRCIKNK